MKTGIPLITRYSRRRTSFLLFRFVDCPEISGIEVKRAVDGGAVHRSEAPSRKLPSGLLICLLPTSLRFDGRDRHSYGADRSIIQWGTTFYLQGG